MRWKCLKVRARINVLKRGGKLSSRLFETKQLCNPVLVCGALNSEKFVVDTTNPVLQGKTKPVYVQTKIITQILVRDHLQQASLPQGHKLDITDKLKCFPQISAHEKSSKQALNTVCDVLARALQLLLAKRLLGERRTPNLRLRVLSPHVLMQLQVAANFENEHVCDKRVLQSTD